MSLRILRCGDGDEVGDANADVDRDGRDDANDANTDDVIVMLMRLVMGMVIVMRMVIVMLMMLIVMRMVM